MKKSILVSRLILVSVSICCFACTKNNNAGPATAASASVGIVGYWYQPSTGNEFTRGLWFKSDGTLRAYNSGVSGPKLPDTGANHYFGTGTYKVTDNLVTFSVDGMIIPVNVDEQGQLDFTA